MSKVHTEHFSYEEKWKIFLMLLDMVPNYPSRLQWYQKKMLEVENLFVRFPLWNAQLCYASKHGVK